MSVSVFENETLRYGLENYLTDAFVRAIERDGRLEIAEEGKGALEVRGKIKEYKREPFEYDEEGNVSKYRVVIKADVGFYDRTTGKYYLEVKTYTGWGFYNADEDEETGIERAAEDLAGEALRALFLASF